MGQENSAERPRAGNEIYGHPLIPQSAVGTDPSDGLPRTFSAVSMEDSKAPPLEPETFVCMGDESVFVIRNSWGAALITLDPSRVRRNRGFGWVAALSDKERELAGSPTSVLGGDQLWFEVEPLREQCAYYRRVMTDFENDHQTEIRAVERVCAAKRTETGEFESLSNMRVHACEHREPRDFVSEERLRKFDQARMDASKKTEEPWDPEAALEEALRLAQREPPK